MSDLLLKLRHEGLFIQISTISCAVLQVSSAQTAGLMGVLRSVNSQHMISLMQGLLDAATPHLSIHTPPVQGLLGVVALLAVPEYREAVLEGLVASIGGLDASLTKEASSALVAALHAPSSGGQPCALNLSVHPNDQPKAIMRSIVGNVASSNPTALLNHSGRLLLWCATRRS